MQVNDLASVDPNVDYTEILPIQQKRTIAFINHFVTNTVSFLNNFARSCESRLMEFEYKLRDLESSLLILESQLSSISHLDVDESVEKLPDFENEEKPSTTDISEAKKELQPEQDLANDPKYQRFFKMLQFGVPATAVKLKMQLEGIDPSILDTNSSIKETGNQITEN